MKLFKVLFVSATIYSGFLLGDYLLCVAGDSLLKAHAWKVSVINAVCTIYVWKLYSTLEQFKHAESLTMREQREMAHIVGKNRIRLLAYVFILLVGLAPNMFISFWPSDQLLWPARLVGVNLVLVLLIAVHSIFNIWECSKFDEKIALRKQLARK